MNDRNQQQQEWQTFVAKLKKSQPNIYQLLKESQLGNLDKDSLTLVFPNEELQKAAKSKVQKIKKVLEFPFVRNRVDCKLETLEQMIVESPLQTLNFTPFKQDSRGNELVQPLLAEAQRADSTCKPLYQQLTEKTQKLADVTLKVQFPWRLRVGGMRGFRDLLLPVFHPVYGVGYIPSSSLKGAVLAWARRHVNASEMNRLLGTLDDGIGCVQILDAFPTKPCLSVDMANPQWHWQNSQVKYNPEPHALLSMESPEFLMGLARTNRGDQDDVQIVKEWLEKALTVGIGSRVSAGYGRTSLQGGLADSSSHNFHLWTQGMYGASVQNPEFRPVAVRGMLRYWFRAIALGLYDADTCKNLETQLFGSLSKEGSIRIGVESQQENGDRPYVYKGKILLEAKEQNHLTLIEKVLQLSSYLAGIGRGTRRPLHWNSGRMRGCHWELGSVQPGEKRSWCDFLNQVRLAFVAVKRPQGSLNISNQKALSTSTVSRPVRRSQNGSGTDSSGSARYQDVLDSKAQIYLVPCPGMRHPKDVRNWPQEGHKSPVTGMALDVLYSSDRYKGERQDNGTTRGNKEVGGKLGIPSFVVIKSNFPSAGQPYQVVTIFGADHRDRAAFAGDLPEGSIQIWPL